MVVGWASTEQPGPHRAPGCLVVGPCTDGWCIRAPSGPWHASHGPVRLLRPSPALSSTKLLRQREHEREAVEGDDAQPGEYDNLGDSALSPSSRSAACRHGCARAAHSRARCCALNVRQPAGWFDAKKQGEQGNAGQMAGQGSGNAVLGRATCQDRCRHHPPACPPLACRSRRRRRPPRAPRLSKPQKVLSGRHSACRRRAGAPNRWGRASRCPRPGSSVSTPTTASRPRESSFCVRRSLEMRLQKGVAFWKSHFLEWALPRAQQSSVCQDMARRRAAAADDMGSLQRHDQGAAPPSGAADLCWKRFAPPLSPGGAPVGRPTAGPPPILAASFAASHPRRRGHHGAILGGHGTQAWPGARHPSPSPP